MNAQIAIPHTWKVYGQRVWRINEGQIPTGVRSVATCKHCSTSFGWAGRKELRPPCPVCFPPLPHRQLGMRRKFVDGVYCDYSHRNGKSHLGFVVFRSGVPHFLSCPAVTHDPEREAVEVVIACGVSPVMVHSDHALTVEATGATYVARNVNPAHRVARKLPGYCDSRAKLRERIKRLVGPPQVPPDAGTPQAPPP